MSIRKFSEYIKIDETLGRGTLGVGGYAYGYYQDYLKEFSTTKDALKSI